jgi:hypothetical protein
MGSTYGSLYSHFVWGTKERRSFNLRGAESLGLRQPGAALARHACALAPGYCPGSLRHGCVEADHVQHGL